MAKFFPPFILGAVLTCIIVVGGCAKSPGVTQDSAPSSRSIPKHLDRVPDPVPKVEPLSRYGNRFKKNSSSYVALKKRYTVMNTSRGYCDHGLASWYGTKFHGRRTSSGEPYDMYAMTAAHKTLPLPTYARVTNLENGKSVIVKVNDRGPFHQNRIIDLSYVAAHKLGIIGKGTGRVKVESVDPRDHFGKIPNTKSRFFARNNRRDKTNTGTNQYAEMAALENKARSTAQQNAIAGNTQANHENIEATEGLRNASSGQKLYLQVGAFNRKTLAENFANKVSTVSNCATSIATQKNQNKSMFKVRLGPFKNQQELTVAKKALAAANLPNPILVQE